MPGDAAAVRDSATDAAAASGRFSFPKCSRLVHSRQFQNVYRNRKAQRAGGRIASCVWAPNGRTTARLGLAVSKKSLPRSTQRNTFKRLVREHFRLHPLPGVDLIVSCRRGVSTPLDRQVIRQDLAEIWEKIDS